MSYRLESLVGPASVVTWATEIREQMLQKFAKRPEVVERLKREADVRWFVIHRDFNFR